MSANLGKTTSLTKANMGSTGRTAIVLLAETMATTTRETLRPRLFSQHLGGPGPGGAVPPLKAVSHNVGGSSGLKVMDLLNRFKPEVLCLQENVLKTTELKNMVKRQGYEAESNFDESGKPGTAMIWKASLQIQGPPQQIEARTLQVLRIRDGGCYIICTVSPPSSVLS